MSQRTTGATPARTRRSRQPSAHTRTASAPDAPATPRSTAAIADCSARLCQGGNSRLRGTVVVGDIAPSHAVSVLSHRPNRLQRQPRIRCVSTVRQLATRRFITNADPRRSVGIPFAPQVVHGRLRTGSISDRVVRTIGHVSPTRCAPSHFMARPVWWPRHVPGPLSAPRARAPPARRPRARSRRRRWSASRRARRD